MADSSARRSNCVEVAQVDWVAELSLAAGTVAAASK